MVLLAVGLVASRLNAQEPIAPQPVTIEGAATHVYKSIDGIDLRSHVFAPAETKVAPRAAIVFFFGGGWIGGTVQQFVPQAKHFAQRGMVAIVADYRVAQRHNTTPFAAMADAKSAIRWVRSRAKELGLDPARIAAAGGSSGGHIAAGAAVFDAHDERSEDARVSSKPDALILLRSVLHGGGEAAQHVHGYRIRRSAAWVLQSAWRGPCAKGMVPADVARSRSISNEAGLPVFTVSVSDTQPLMAQ
jgi:acetyl esterase/lipase